MPHHIVCLYVCVRERQCLQAPRIRLLYASAQCHNGHRVATTPNCENTMSSTMGRMNTKRPPQVHIDGFYDRNDRKIFIALFSRRWWTEHGQVEFEPVCRLRPPYEYSHCDIVVVRFSIAIVTTAAVAVTTSSSPIEIHICLYIKFRFRLTFLLARAAGSFGSNHKHVSCAWRWQPVSPSPKIGNNNLDKKNIRTKQTPMSMLAPFDTLQSIKRKSPTCLLPIQSHTATSVIVALKSTLLHFSPRHYRYYQCVRAQDCEASACRCWIWHSNINNKLKLTTWFVGARWRLIVHISFAWVLAMGISLHHHYSHSFQHRNSYHAAACGLVQCLYSFCLLDTIFLPPCALFECVPRFYFFAVFLAFKPNKFLIFIVLLLLCVRRRWRGGRVDVWRIFRRYLRLPHKNYSTAFVRRIEKHDPLDLLPNKLYTQKCF